MPRLASLIPPPAGIIALAVLAAASACAPGPPADPDGPCPELPGTVHDSSTRWVFALGEEVDPSHVRRPHTDSEEIVFRHAYEGLVDVDCRGELVPRLAASWSATEDDRVWTFELREGSTFDDGTPVTAESVARSWFAARVRGKKLAHRAWMWKKFFPRDVATDGARLTVTLREADPDFVFQLAEPEFFVLAAGPAGWPLGTRNRIPQVRETADGLEISFASAATTDRADGSTTVTFRVRPDVDPRDAFGADTHAMLTRNRQALRYLTSQPHTRQTPLPWSRRYTLTDPTGAFTWLERSLPMLRSELVRDVLPSVARAPWDPSRPDPSEPAPTEAFTIRFPKRDRDAAALAERVASLATRREDAKRWVVVGTSPSSAYAGDTPAVIALPRSRFDPSTQRQTTPGPALGGVPYPLAETRAVLVTRRGITGIRIGWDGVPRLDAAGFTRGGTP